MSNWNLSPESDEDCRNLFEYADKLSDPQSERGIVELIDRLVYRNESGAILAIASQLFSKRASIHDAASVALQKLVPHVQSSDLIRLDEMFRGYRGWYLSEPWNELGPKEAKKFLDKSKDMAVGCLLSCHHKGYVRHQALRFLASVDNGAELQFLLLRQNDWVTSIAQEAQAMVLQKLDSDYLPYFAKELDLMFHQLKCKRWDLSEPVKKFIDLIILPKHRRQLELALNSCGKKMGRIFVAHLLERDGDHSIDVVRAGVASEDSIVRCRCLKLVDKYLDKNECNRIADHLQFDKFIPVRMEACELKARLSPRDSEQVWRRCLFDKSKSIRQSAIFYLQKSGCDTAAIYRQRIAEDPNCRPALAGLVEVGDESDLPLFSNYLVSPFSSRRIEAIRGIGKHGDESTVIELRQMILDDNASVVRNACRQLNPVVKAIDSGMLFDMLEQCETLAGEDAILRLLLEKGRWSALSYLLRTVVEGKPNCAETARDLVWQAFSENRSFTQPTLNQRAEIQKVINASISTLDDPFWRDLASVLSSYGFKFPPRD